MKRIVCLILAALLVLPGAAQAAGGFTDVPETSWAVPSIQAAKTYGLMQGVGGGAFGYGQTIDRASFVTILVRMMGWETTGRDSGFADVPAAGWAAPYITAAAAHDVMDRGGLFRPADEITREEMAVMLVRALGYKNLAAEQAGRALPFGDVSANRGYIAVAYDIGMTNGVSADRFAPDQSATREQAAAMLVRIYEKYTAKTGWLHGFYAISSYSQIDLTREMNEVSLGWSHMTYSPGAGPALSTSRADSVYGIPSGYADAVQQMQANGCKLNLSVYMNNSGGQLAAMLAAEDGTRGRAVNAIVQEATRVYDGLGASPYSGVTIDFEGLYGETSRAKFNQFLQVLADALAPRGLTLHVMVHPQGEGLAFDGYDYRTIGELADKVILMAHDYQPLSMAGFEGTEYYKTAALTPISRVYEALRLATDPETGVQDRSKLALALSWNASGWAVDENAKLLSTEPIPVSPDTVVKRMKEGAVMGWSDAYRNPYLTYATEEGQHIFLWYEDGRSAAEKVRLAKLFGVTSVSLWRLGNLPNQADESLYFNWLPACQ